MLMALNHCDTDLLTSAFTGCQKAGLFETVDAGVMYKTDVSNILNNELP